MVPPVIPHHLPVATLASSGSAPKLVIAALTQQMGGVRLTAKVSMWGLVDVISCPVVCYRGVTISTIPSRVPILAKLAYKKNGGLLIYVSIYAVRVTSIDRLH